MEILRRLGSRPTHAGKCGCPRSFAPIVRMTVEGDFAFTTPTEPVERHDEFTEQIRAMDPDGGGGVASYERVAIVDRQLFIQSARLAFDLCGIRTYPDGSEQEPLVMVTPNEYPERVFTKMQ